MWFVLLSVALALAAAMPEDSAAINGKPKDEPRHYLYVVAPGIRNYLEFGGAGILVFDMDNNYKFVKRIATPASQAAKPENIKGVCACAKTRKLYFTTLTKIYCIDLVTEKTLWEKQPPGGCDRLSITPDGKWIYLPSFEKEHWHILDASTGDVVKKLVPKSGAHNTVCSPDGTRAYLAGLKSEYLLVVDAKTHAEVGKVGPFSAAIRPFTVDGSNSRCYVCVNGLLGFEVGDIKTGKKLYRVEVEGFKPGKTKRHGCPSHGVGLTPNEKEVWVCDAANSRLHVFNNTVTPPKQIASVKLREQPGWVSFSIDGKVCISSTGEIIDTKSKKVIAALFDEEVREVHGEKDIEIVFVDGVPVLAGDQFGLGRQGLPQMK
jgi:DNA-binding beta-propeller fold protein YncE